MIARRGGDVAAACIGMISPMIITPGPACHRTTREG